MIGKLAGIDRKIGLLLAASTILLLGTYFLYTTPQNNALADAQARYSIQEQTVTTLKRRVAEIQKDGTSSIDTLVQRVTDLETALPLKVDDLEVTRTAAERAINNQVILLSFDPSTEVNSVPPLGYNLYSFSVKGSPENVINWLVDTVKSTDHIITVNSAQVNNVEVSSANQSISTFQGEVILSGSFRVWFSQKPGLTTVTSQENDTKPSTSPSTTPSAAPVEPVNPSVDSNGSEQGPQPDPQTSSPSNP
ncbi:MAG: hypothetical protein ACKOW9_06150 [Candidatus Paceibacterota bacterium]